MVLLGALLAPGLYPESPGEYEVKAAFLYSFGKFVEWPPLSFRGDSDPLLICILGSNPFGKTLEQGVQGKQIGGRAVRVRQLAANEPLGRCRILFVSFSGRKQFQALAGATQNAGVLSVGEHVGFTAEGGVIEFKLEDGKIRLEINIAAAEYQGLRISSKLLSLAHVVRRAP